VNAVTKYLLAAAVGLALGLWSAEASLTNGGMFDVTKIGAWRVSQRAGTPEADPYTRADLERSGEIPLALGEGLQFVADADDRGDALSSACAYEIGPRTPPARYWTLSLVDRSGFPIENPAGRYGFRSTEILRAANGDFHIAVAAAAQPGNWLPIGGSGNFRLVLRLYDSPVSATAGGIDKSALPGIARGTCF
jgi:hypothetical protein